jgi:hypothetical protein
VLAVNGVLVGVVVKGSAKCLSVKALDVLFVGHCDDHCLGVGAGRGGREGGETEREGREGGETGRRLRKKKTEREGEGRLKAKRNGREEMEETKKKGNK